MAGPDELEQASFTPEVDGSGLDQAVVDDVDGFRSVRRASSGGVPSRSARIRIGVGAGIVLTIGAAAVAVVVTLVGGRGDFQSVDDPQELSPTMSASRTPAAQGDSLVASSATVFVHVFGAVIAPGLYELREGSRVIDAISAAGGFTGDADRDQANLARVLVDGEQLGIAREGETLPLSDGAAAGAGGPGPAATSPDGRVNLNVATVVDLQTLPQVGPATAQSIVDWRTQNGRFSTVEELMSISGIGQKTYDRLKDLVTV